MENIIQNFISFHLPNFCLLTKNDDAINLYVQKIDNNFILGANIEVLKKMNLNDDELICLLFHEKGHVELNHLENSLNIEINVMLFLIVGILYFMFVLISCILNFSYISVLGATLLPLLCFINFVKGFHSLRKREIDADKYAIKNTSVSIFISLMTKIYTFYENKSKPTLLNKLFSSHPNYHTRILLALKNK